MMIMMIVTIVVVVVLTMRLPVTAVMIVIVVVVFVIARWAIRVRPRTIIVGVATPMIRIVVAKLFQTGIGPRKIAEANTVDAKSEPGIRFRRSHIHKHCTY